MYRKEGYFSRQGHSSAMMFASNRVAKKRQNSYEDNDEPNEAPSVDKVLEVVHEAWQELKVRPSKQKQQLSSCFAAVDRTKRDAALRSRTEPPEANQYYPRHNLDTKKVVAHKFSSKPVSPREKRILIPPCMHECLSCNYPNRSMGASPHSHRKRKSSPDPNPAM